MRTALAVGLLCALASPAAGQSAPPAFAPYAMVSANGIPTIPAPLTAKAGDPKAGQQVVIDRSLGNCLSCHEIGALRTEPFHGEIGPPLDGVAGRWDTAALRMILVNAKKVFGDGTVMPAFYRIDGLNRVRPEFAGKPILSAQQIEDVVAYLATMK
jgi:sulfur-oxidizing protein SoxX